MIVFWLFLVLFVIGYFIFKWITDARTRDSDASRAYEDAKSRGDYQAANAAAAEQKRFETGEGTKVGVWICVGAAFILFVFVMAR